MCTTSKGRKEIAQVSKYSGEYPKEPAFCKSTEFIIPTFQLPDDRLYSRDLFESSKKVEPKSKIVICQKAKETE